MASKSKQAAKHNNRNRNHNRAPPALIIGVVFGVLALLFVIALIWYLRSRRMRRREQARKGEGEGPERRYVHTLVS